MGRRVILTAILGLALGSAPAARAADPLPPGGKFSLTKGSVTAKEFAAALETASGLKLDVSAVDAGSTIPADLKEVGYWAALDHLAKHTNSRLAIGGGGIALKPAATAVPSSVSGPFRVAATEVNLRRDFAAGTNSCDLHLEIAWLPTTMVFRTDTAPTVTSLTDDAGAKLTASSASARTHTAGTVAPLILRPQGVKRAAKSLTVAGWVQLTIADELLTFQFDAAGKPPLNAPKQQGVAVVIRKMKTVGADLLVEVQLDYPPSPVVWESFENASWTRNNRLRLVPPKGEPILPDRTEPDDRSITYLFKNRAGKIAADWKLEYQTPGPMREVKAPFELKGIELP
jgi:hypothetical protein